MEFRTKINLPFKEIQITPESRILTLGSCFAQHIGARFLSHKLDCEVNPFGILYNPASIALALNRLCAEGSTLPQELYFKGRDAVWHSWLHHSDFSATTKEACQALVTQRLSVSQSHLSKTNLLIITLGTNRCYQLNETNQVVANCHKEAAHRFTTHELSVEEIVNLWRPALDSWFEKAPQSKVLFTVSPYRYASYGFHQSQLSKATLLLAIDQLIQHDPTRCCYFPAYEIVLDELRDYRFYNSDMLHPSPTAIDYIWECITQSYFTPETLSFIEAWKRISSDLAHRPLHPESEAYHTFLQRCLEKLQEFAQRYPHLSLEAELHDIAQRQKP